MVTFLLPSWFSIDSNRCDEQRIDPIAPNTSQIFPLLWNNQFIITFILHRPQNGPIISPCLRILTWRYTHDYIIFYIIKDMRYNFSWSIASSLVTISFITSKIMTNPGFNRSIVNGFFWKFSCNIKWINIMCTASTVQKSQLTSWGILTSRVTQV